jgi:hypothetical protein
MLSVSLQPADSAAGHRAAIAVLANTGDTTCTLYGNPGLELGAANGRSNLPSKAEFVNTSERTTVTLQPNGSAKADLHWSVVPSDNDPNGTCEIPDIIGITPPGETTLVSTSWNLGPVCEQGTIQITPVHP